MSHARVYFFFLDHVKSGYDVRQTMEITCKKFDISANHFFRTFQTYALEIVAKCPMDADNEKRAEDMEKSTTYSWRRWRKPIFPDTDLFTADLSVIDRLALPVLWKKYADFLGIKYGMDVESTVEKASEAFGSTKSSRTLMEYREYLANGRMCKVGRKNTEDVRDTNSMSQAKTPGNMVGKGASEMASWSDEFLRMWLMDGRHFSIVVQTLSKKTGKVPFEIRNTIRDIVREIADIRRVLLGVDVASLERRLEEIFENEECEKVRARMTDVILFHSKFAGMLPKTGVPMSVPIIELVSVDTIREAVSSLESEIIRYQLNLDFHIENLRRKVEYAEELERNLVSISSRLIREVRLGMVPALDKEAERVLEQVRHLLKKEGVNSHG